MNWSLSVIVPVYNEAALLEPAIATIDGYLQARGSDYEIVIVESGSTDGSGDICDLLQARLPAVRVVHEGGRNGFGAAVGLGYREARKALVWLVTVDHPFPLECLEQAVPLLDRYDCVLSYRAADPRPLQRRVQSWVYNGLVRSVLGLPMRHVNSAFKVLKRDVARGLPVRARGWFFDAELLYRIHRGRVSWTEIPVPLLDRGAGRGSVGPLTFLSVLRELVTFLRSERLTAGRRHS
jgi:dolichol-phosphate mannosyltransferase